MIKLDQEELDELLKQDHVKKNNVIKPLAKTTAESEASTNKVTGYLKNVLTVISRQKSFLADIIDKYNEKPETINVTEVLNFLKNDLEAIEKQVLNAKDALKSRDIGRQKLIKMRDTLATLHEYISKLLNVETED